MEYVILLAAVIIIVVLVRSKNQIIADKDSHIANLREELRDWQNKALFKQGLSPLGRETSKRETPKNSSPKARVITRGELEMRVTPETEEEIPSGAKNVTIHADSVRPPVSDTVRRAAEILNK